MLTAKDIQKCLLGERYRQSFVIPHYTPHQWWECDVFELTKAGYFREYEIKVSLADYVADASKSKITSRKVSEVQPALKHKLLEQGAVHGPTAFFFVVPKELVAKVMQAGLPPFAGLLEAEPIDWSSWYKCRIKQVIAAPRLHRQKAAPGVIDHANGVCYWRMHKMMMSVAC